MAKSTICWGSFVDLSIIMNKMVKSKVKNKVSNKTTMFVVNIQIQCEIFICVAGGISDPNLEAG